MNLPPSILLLPNAGPGVGGGHVMRCLSLARALRARGAECAFATAGEGVRLIERFGDGLFAVIDDAVRAAPSAIVFDNYAVGDEVEGVLATPGRALMAIDDLADRAHAVDLLLDPGFGRAAADYAGKVPEGARLLLGPEHALLRPAFAARRPAAFGPVRDRVERAFVSFGLSDVSGIAARAVALIRRAAPDVRVDVALASDAASLPELERWTKHDGGLGLHVDALDIAGLMSAADLCVGAGGSATWERACLGAPTLAAAIADNQRPLIRALDRAGALIGLDLADPAFEAGFLGAFERLRSPALRARHGERSRGLCDGLGAERAAEALLSVLASKR